MYYTEINGRQDRISFPEIVISYYLNLYGVKYEKSKYFDIPNDEGDTSKMTLDFYLNDFNLAIEYDGCKYHGEPIRDLEKDLRISVLELSLLRIREEGCSCYHQKDFCINTNYIYSFCSKYAHKKHFNQSMLKRDRESNIINDFDLELINYFDVKRKTTSLIRYLIFDFVRYKVLYSKWKSIIVKNDFTYIIIPKANYKQQAEETVREIISFLNSKYNMNYDLNLINVNRDYKDIINQPFLIKK